MALISPALPFAGAITVAGRELADILIHDVMSSPAWQAAQSDVRASRAAIMALMHGGKVPFGRGDGLVEVTDATLADLRAMVAGLPAEIRVEIANALGL